MSAVEELSERELDAAVAERVMGLTVTFSLALGGDWTGTGIETGYERVRPYSTSIEAAMQVVEKMRERGFAWDARSPHGRGWEVYCYRRDKRGRGDKHRGLLPEAICRAALRALEQEK